MNFDEWAEKNLPKKDKLSAVEARRLVKIAFIAGFEQAMKIRELFKLLKDEEKLGGKKKPKTRGAKTMKRPDYTKYDCPFCGHIHEDGEIQTLRVQDQNTMHVEKECEKCGEWFGVSVGMYGFATFSLEDE